MRVSRDLMTALRSEYNYGNKLGSRAPEGDICQNEIFRQVELQLKSEIGSSVAPKICPKVRTKKSPKICPKVRTEARRRSRRWVVATSPNNKAYVNT